ncbi:HAD-IC family P-type ATPase [Desulfosporosinus sp. OT]|uniref:heavy metal translocating P-type ATPase n=1 Tax=Desulfosporosinus sp. OT TaxID=913865 RepID=UPI0002239E1F|nr:HAD-IC family P-type ATPase [Desulfosporosinus sp. OT]EGW40064.1 ATPase, P-type (transporting), HAD super, subIC family protein [Desulfosporosinus sp. OT]
MIETKAIWNKYVHYTPGRIRLKVPGLKKNDYLAEKIHNALENIEGIDQIGTNLLTGTLLVHFHENLIHGSSIIIFVDDHRRKYNYPVPLTEKLSPMITQRANKIFLISAALVLLFTKSKLFGPSALASSNILNNTATAIGLIIAYPIFLWGLKHPQQTRNRSYDLVINSITFTLLLLQESYTGLLLMLLVNYSKIIMALDFTRTNQIIARIGKLPEKVWVVIDKGEVAMPLEKLVSGDLVVVRNAEIIPVDGTVVDGEAVVDESQISGKSEPINKLSGSKVLAGTEILDGSLKILVEQTGFQTQLSKLTRRAVHKNDQPDEAIFRQRIDRMVYFSLMAAGGIYLLTGNLNRSLAILIVASPSAAGLAVPTANGVAIGKAAQRGIYVKNGNHLWDASEVDTMVLDKVPSLTVMKTTIQEIVVVNKEYTQSEILRIASMGEGMEGNPLVEIIRKRGYLTNFGPVAAGVETEFIPKLGIRAQMKGKKILLGTKTLMLQENVKLNKVESKVLRFRHLGLNPIYLAVEGRLCGLFGVRETIKPEVRGAIEQLRALGIRRIVLLTRDEFEAAEIVANQLGIVEFHSRMTPNKKAKFIKTLNMQGHKVAMLGDGIDDALAMSEAEVGIAWGKKGADSAAKVAGIVISAQDPQVLVEAMLLAQKTKEVAKQNINFAIGINVIGLGLGAGGLINNVSAAFLGQMGTVITVFNTYYQKWF